MGGCSSLPGPTGVLGSLGEPGTSGASAVLSLTATGLPPAVTGAVRPTRTKVRIDHVRSTAQRGGASTHAGSNASAIRFPSSGTWPVRIPRCARSTLASIGAIWPMTSS